MLTTATPPTTTELTPAPSPLTARILRPAFAFVAERLWLDFVNTDGGTHSADAVGDFDSLVAWLESANALDAERAQMMRRRALQQPSGATAALMDGRRVRSALRSLAERGAVAPQIRMDALTEINRVLGRSAGTRRLEMRGDGTFARSFVPVGDAFAGLVMPFKDGGLFGLVFTPEHVFTVGDTVNLQWKLEAHVLKEPYRGADAYVTRNGLLAAQVSTFDPERLRTLTR